MDKDLLLKNLRNIPDFPIPGIQFKDVTSLFKKPECLREMDNALYEIYKDKGITKIVGIESRGFVMASSLAVKFIAGFVISGLDYRFGWSYMPVPITIIGSVLFIVAYLLYAFVLRENTYLSRTIKVEQGQRVVDTGLYGLVRHPMYMATILLFLMMPIVLGSWCALIVFGIYPVIIVIRLKDEEKLLTQELPGYAEYKQKVKYRIIPYIW